MFTTNRMLKGSSHQGYEVARQDSSSDNSDDEEETFLGENEQDPPDEEDPEGATADEDISISNIDVEMTAVHPEPATADVANEATAGEISLEALGAAPEEQPLEETPIESLSDVTEETPFQVPPAEPALPPSYKEYKDGANYAPPEYEDAVAIGEGAADAVDALQDTPASPDDEAPPMELSRVGDDVDNVRNEDIEARNETSTASDDESVPDFIPDPLRPAYRQVRAFRPRVKTAIFTIVNVGIALFILLIVLSVARLEYFQMGLKMRRVSNLVFYMDEAFEAGRYFLGPRNIFKPYPAIAHSMEFEDIGVYTTDPLRISFHCHFHFFIKKSELGLLEDELDRYYLETIEQVAITSIKNTAAMFSVDDFLEKRLQIERAVHGDLRVALEGTCCLTRDQCNDFSSCHNCYEESTTCIRGLHIEVPFFNLLAVQFPDSVLSRKQEVLVVALAGEEEEFHQDEVLTRKRTERLVQDILNEASVISANATAYSSLIRSKAKAEANAILNSANSKGLLNMYSNLTIVEEDHKASIHWLTALKTHQNLVTGIAFEEYLKLTKERW